MMGRFCPSCMRSEMGRRLESGEINLVAAQLQLEREHQNKITFTPEAGLDPQVDVALTGSRLRYLIKGRASQWQDHIVLTSTGSRSQTGPGAGGTLGCADVSFPFKVSSLMRNLAAGLTCKESSISAVSSFPQRSACGLSWLMPSFVRPLHDT